MRLTMTRTSLLFAAAVPLMLVGCGDKYGRSEHDAASSQFAQVASMLAELRSSGPGGVDEAMAQQAADGLDKGRSASLAATLTMLVRAEQAELTRLDSFGKDIYRAAIQVAYKGRRRSVYVLLVDDGDDLRWAGRN